MKIVNTRNYRLFVSSDENRPLDVAAHKNLKTSMEEYGFLPCFPIIVLRKGDKLIVLDGQHRLAIAEALGLAVYYVEVKSEFDIARINSTAKTWIPRDHAQKFASNGVQPYREGLEFAAQHNLALSIAFALLGGTVNFANLQHLFYSGAFKVKDREYADKVASLYTTLVKASPSGRKNTRLLEACMGVCRVPDVDLARLVRNASRCADKLREYSTKEAYLEMLEEVYNHGKHLNFGLKAAATNAMRERHPAKPKSNSNGHKTAS